MIDFDDLEGAEPDEGEAAAPAVSWREAAARQKEQERLAKEQARKEEVKAFERKRAEQIQEKERRLKEKGLAVEEEHPEEPAEEGRRRGRRVGDPLPPLKESPWFGCSRHNPTAAVRVFCLHGVGVAAASYTDWVSKERHERWPLVELVSVELPGHGTHHQAPAIEELGALADAFVEMLGRWTRWGALPFALYGFSFGARLMYEVCLRLGREGGCRKAYAACRGAPHHIAFDAPASASARARKGAGKDAGGPNEKEELLVALASLVDGEQLTKYRLTFDRWEKLASKGDKEYAGRIGTFRRSLEADIEFCDARMNANLDEDGLPRKFPCPLRLLHSEGDEMWPPQRGWPPAKLAEMAGYDEWGWTATGTPCYKDLATGWALFAEDFDSEIVLGSHGECGGPGSMIPDRICADLTALVESGQL
mmetsp:Transcript_130218/g.291184  ORF Transcript_130218/g.291184 Transcript_130218/m.291184 type:complete len:422 (-) Transcript_130218:86-1351(-)